MDINDAYSLSERVNYLMRKQGKSLSVAESCTGGLIAHWLTNVPGASEFFLLSVVTYSVEAKKRVLGIDKEIVEKYGVVSPEMAGEMARGIVSITGSDYAIATTGNLGPTALEDKETGLVYIALWDGKDMSIKELRLSGDRLTNKETVATEALKMLLHAIENNEVDYC